MVNACTPQGEQISGTGCEKKIGLCAVVAYAIYPTSGRRCGKLERVQSSDGGISFPPAMAPNLSIGDKLGLDSPKSVASFPKIGIGQMDSQAEFFAPSDVQVNLRQCLIIQCYLHTQNFTPFAGPAGV